jgi:hypothetical protein
MCGPQREGSKRILSGATRILCSVYLVSHLLDHLPNVIKLKFRERKRNEETIGAVPNSSGNREQKETNVR